MVKKVIVIACLAASLLIFLDTIDIVRGLFMFLLAGIIPGTDIALSPNQMLVFMFILTVLSVALIGQNQIKVKLSKVTNKKTTSRRRLNRA